VGENHAGTGRRGGGSVRLPVDHQSSTGKGGSRENVRGKDMETAFFNNRGMKLEGRGRAEVQRRYIEGSNKSFR